MRYIILTVLLFLNITLSASNVTPEDNQRSHSNLSYIGSIFFPKEIKLTVLSDPSFSPENIGSFGLTNRSNYQLVSAHYPAKLTLGALRYAIKMVFINHNSFNNAEDAIDAANLFLEAYFPNEKAINTFIDIYLPIQDIQEPYKAFLEYISGCFPNDKNKAYFDMRKQIIVHRWHGNGVYGNGVYASFDFFNTAFLPPEILDIINLRKLNLSNNQLQFFPNLSTLTELRDLSLSDNQLQTMPIWIANLPNLRRLNLSNNPLETVPDRIANLTNLTIYF